ncbi:MAG: RNA polymerase sigma factor [Phycisphaerae bacterium]
MAPESRMPEDAAELLQRAYRYALALTHDPDAAEEVVQDAFVSVSRRGGPWNAGYLFTAVRNRYIDVYRRRQKLPMMALEDFDAAAAPAGGMADDELEQALARLRSEEREALMLNVVEGYSASEIGEMTGKPRGTVLSLIHRAKIKLREILPEEARPAGLGS